MRLAADALLLVFLLSGGLFLAFPDQLYNTGGWAVWIKYVAFVGLLGYLALWISYGANFGRQQLAVFLLWNCMLLISVTLGAAPNRVILYAVPSFAIFAPVLIHQRVAAVVPLILTATVAGALYEYFVLGGFERFAPNGYRGVSIFVNPNNLAVTTVALAALGAPYMRPAVRMLTASVTLGIVLYSGSKTGLIIFAFLVIYFINQRQAASVILKGIVVGGFGLVALAAAALIGVVQLPLESTFDRFRQVTEFVSIIENPLFPFLSDASDDAYVDNMFMQVWLETGLAGLVSFIGLLLLTAYRDGTRSPLWVIFGLAAITTNIMYLWPIGYLFWMYVGSIVQWQQTRQVHA